MVSYTRTLRKGQIRWTKEKRKEGGKNRKESAERPERGYESEEKEKEKWNYRKRPTNKHQEMGRR